MPRPRRASNAVEPLIGVAALISRWIERVLAFHEPQLTLGQFLALRAIAAEPLTAAELARRTAVSSAAVSQLVAALDHAGWIERSHAPEDRRRQTLALTTAGADAYRSASRSVHIRLGELLAALPHPEADRLGGSLERLEQALSGTPPPRRPPPPRPGRR